MKLIKDEYDHEYFVVNDKRWPVSDSFKEDLELSRPSITHDGWMHMRGCRIRFESGWSISIIWGNLTYSSNRNPNLMGPDPEFSEEPTHVEIMVMDYDGHAPDEDIVLGYVSETEMTFTLNFLAMLPTKANFNYLMIRNPI